MYIIYTILYDVLFGLFINAYTIYLPYIYQQYVYTILYYPLLLQIYPHLVSEWQMSPTLINDTKQWADIQSLLHRVTLDFDISIKLPMIRNLHASAKGLYKWSRSRSSAYRVLVEKVGSTSLASDDLNKLNPIRRMRGKALDRSTSNKDLRMQVGEDDYSDAGSALEEAVIDQETDQSENHNEDADDSDEDSDNAGVVMTGF